MRQLLQNKVCPTLKAVTEQWFCILNFGHNLYPCFEMLHFILWDFGYVWTKWALINLENKNRYIEGYVETCRFPSFSV